ncbi:N-6 DNA methylase [Haloimpatiens massiliensis]|uniref:N-6 DNA methylase n=1 Tax=Haloimpatiens massiliensis TaxID=1658110 RepID=UPI000C837035|nr:N-6 DNA methylase [Haloimpatiens massiliensis]
MQKLSKIIKHNGIEITSLLAVNQVEMLIKNNSSNLMDLKVDEEHMLHIAENINEVLHLASINKDDRAAVIASLLLAQIDSKLNLNESPSIIVRDINNRAEDVLIRHNKREFYDYIEIKLPNNIQAQKKYKKALMKTMSLLNEINIKAAMNSGTDILGKFYEVFLKYGNGAKDIGIVLIPRQITKFACEVLDINENDIVYDPTCGTGGFLVSAYDYVRKNCSIEKLDDFKKHKIFGIEQQPKIASLAIVNMIFRGDGKNNIINDDCLKKHITRKKINESFSAEYLTSNTSDEERIYNKFRPITKVLMNPPFSLKPKDEKEYKFIEHALDQMQDGGILFSVLPYSVLVKQEDSLRFRKKLLRDNTLLSVITFPKDLFYPVGVQSVGIIIKKGISHPWKQNVLWIRALKDGYIKVKGKRLFCENEQNHIEKIKNLVRQFIKEPSMRIKEIDKFQIASVIDIKDDSLELVPEVYLTENKNLPFSEITNGIDEVITRFIAFSILNKMISLDELSYMGIKSKKIEHNSPLNLMEVSILDILGKPNKGPYHVHGQLLEGDIPLISTTTQNNGIVGLYEIPDRNIFKNAITIACDGTPLTTFYHPYKFTAKDNVIVFNLSNKIKLATVFYIIMEINRVKWRFSYGRKCYLNKVDKIKILLPCKNNKEIDDEYIERLMKSFSGWKLVKKIISKYN